MSGPLEPVPTRTLHQVWMCRSIGARVLHYANFRRTEFVRRARQRLYTPRMAGKKARGELQRFYSLTNQLRIQLQALDEAVPSVRVEIQEAPSPGGADEGDIEAIAFLVTLEASHSAQDDLRAVQVKAITAHNRNRTQLLRYLFATYPHGVHERAAPDFSETASHLRVLLSG
jgi:hypothetical protein